MIAKSNKSRGTENAALERWSNKSVGTASENSSSLFKMITKSSSGRKTGGNENVQLANIDSAVTAPTPSIT